MLLVKRVPEALALSVQQLASAGCLPQKRNGTDMARPQTGGFSPKPGKERNSGPNKMRMSHLRMRKDIKRIETEQAKAAALEVPKVKRR